MTMQTSVDVIGEAIRVLASHPLNRFVLKHEYGHTMLHTVDRTDFPASEPPVLAYALHWNGLDADTRETLQGHVEHHNALIPSALVPRTQDICSAQDDYRPWASAQTIAVHGDLLSLCPQLERDQRWTIAGELVAKAGGPVLRMHAYHEPPQHALNSLGKFGESPCLCGEPLKSRYHDDFGVADRTLDQLVEETRQIVAATGPKALGLIKLSCYADYFDASEISIYADAHEAMNGAALKRGTGAGVGSAVGALDSALRELRTPFPFEGQ